MNALTLFITEIILVSVFVILTHRFKYFFGFGFMLIFLGSVQFYQTVLASSVYNEIFDNIIISPGSTVLFSSTLCTILLLFHTEGVKVTRTATFGLLFTNVFLALLSYITVKQLSADNHSLHIDYLNLLFNFDITLFLIGTIVMLIDFFLLIIIYQFINLKFSFLFHAIKIYIPLALISAFDSIVFYNINFVSIEKETNLLYSNILGKQIAVLIFSILICLYLKILNIQKVKETPKNIEDVLAVFSFSDEK